MAKKKILLLSDDLRLTSGIATVSRDMVIGTVQHFDWIQVGAAINHPEKGKILDPFYYKLNDDKPAAHCFNQAKEFVINDLETAIINSKSYTYDAVVGDLPESMV